MKSVEDPCFGTDRDLWLMDPDPVIFVIDPQDAANKVNLHHFSKIKSPKGATKQ